MEQEYLEEEIKNTTVTAKNAFTKSVVPIQEKPKRGGLNQITDLREQTAKLLDKPFEQVATLTKGWTVQMLYHELNVASKFINPPALWWKRFKENHAKNKKIINERRLRRVGEKSRGDQQKERQGVLF